MAVISNQNILGLEVTVVDPDGVAELNSVQQLEEDVLGKSVISNETASLGNVAEQITFRAVLDYNKCAVGAVQNAHQGNHIGMLAGLVVHGNLSTLEALLSRVQSMFGESLDGVEFVGVNVDSLIDDTVGTNSKNGNEFESVGQNTAEPIFWSEAC